jgi:hypothetical protein
MLRALLWLAIIIALSTHSSTDKAKKLNHVIFTKEISEL